jgi:hypothetical protein
MEAREAEYKARMEAIEAKYRARRREIDANLRERLANIEAIFKKEGTKEQHQPLDGRLGHIEKGEGDAKPAANDTPTLSSRDIQEEVIQNGSEQIMDGEIETSAQTPEAESTITEEFMTKMEAGLRAVIKENLRKMEEEKKRAAEETEAVAESREVSERATDEETSGGTEDRAGELRLAVRRHIQRKKRAQVNGGPRQNFAAARGRFTRHAVPAMRKGHVRRGPGMKYRRSGVRGPGKTFHSRIDGRSLKQRQTQDNVVRETPEGRTYKKRRRTRPECNSGILRLRKTSGNGMRGWTRKLDRRLKERTVNEAIRKSPRREIVRSIFESSVGLREPGNGTLWKCRPPPKRKR